MKRYIGANEDDADRSLYMALPDWTFANVAYALIGYRKPGF